jgi:broad specificity phosphatase PhoE
VFYIRHGERADNSCLQHEQQKIIFEWDPPLTNHGELQALETGKYLA